MNVKIFWHNHINIRIETEFAVHTEINGYFCYQIADWQFLKKQPKFYHWDGNVRLYNKKHHLLPYGLLYQLELFCKDREYNLIVDSKIVNNCNKLTKDDFNSFIKDIEINPKYKLRDYQEESIVLTIRNKRLTCISPTSSGKSLIAFSVSRWILQNTTDKILIVVPTIGLVEQMAYDFADYGYKDECHKITAGVDKNSNKRIYISTFHSLLPFIVGKRLVRIVLKNKKVLDYHHSKKVNTQRGLIRVTKLTKRDTIEGIPIHKFSAIRTKPNPEYFKQFSGLICDEIHGLKVLQEAKTMNKIATLCTEAEYRLGLTGTLKDILLNKLQIEGLFGKVYNAITTKELMNRGNVAQFKINSIIINYPNDIAKQIQRLEWDKQQVFVETKENPRQELIIDLATSLKKNTLILFRKITHGTYIYEQLVKNTNKEILYIDGSVNKNDREEIRLGMEEKKDAILVASFGTFSTGVDIHNLSYIIFASSSKSKTRVLQSIGRSLRLHKDKDKAILYDIVDNLGYFKKHYEKRLEYYIHEGFQYREKSININEYEKLHCQ